MKFVINFEKKHFYSSLLILVVIGAASFVFAAYNPGHPGDDISVNFNGEEMSLSTAMGQLSGAVSDVEAVSTSCSITSTDMGNCDQVGECDCEVSCPSGKKVISGGAYINDPTDETCGFSYSGPSSDGSSWKVGMLPRDHCGNLGASSGAITVVTTAVCVG